MRNRVIWLMIATLFLPTIIEPQADSPTKPLPTVDVAFVSPVKQIEPPDYISIRKASDARIAAQEAADAAEAQRQAEAATQAIQVSYVAPAVNYSDAKTFIYMSESGNRTDAINASSGACGLGQALPCSKMPCSLSDYACQDAFFTGYMQSRYGTWDAAMAFWVANRWW